MVGFSILLHLEVFNRTCLDLAHSSVVWFRLIQTGRPLILSSVFVWLRVTRCDSGVTPPRLSMNVQVQSTPVTACASCSMSSDACCACRCQGGYLCCRIGHRSPPLCLDLSLYPSSLLQSLCLPSPLAPCQPPSSFSLFCTDTLVLKSAHYAVRWPCIAFYIWLKAVNDTENRRHMKRKKRVHTEMGLMVW